MKRELKRIKTNNDMERKSEIIARVTSKSPTNGGMLCKQYFMLVKSEGFENTLVIDKNILAKDMFEYFESHGFLLKKEF